MIELIVVVAAILIAGLAIAYIRNLVAESDDEADFILKEEEIRKAEEKASLEEEGLTSSTL